jgi:hypothetical protein
VPAVRVGIREDEDLTGLHPGERDRTERTVGDCDRALCAGDRIRNLSN